MGCDPKIFSLLFPDLDLLIQHDRSLNGHVVFGLQVLKRRGLVARLPFEIVILHLRVSELEVQCALRVAEGSDFFLEGVLRVVGFGFTLLVFCFPFLNLVSQLLYFLLQSPFPLFALLHILFELGL